MKAQELVPLRIVLRNFLNHIESLESQNCPEKSYEAEFQDLKIFSENVKTLKEYSCLEGEKEVNRKKNRYKDILPFDISRVVLSEYAGIPGSDYINANYIKGASGSLAYIASQGPLPSTVNDFWRMVVECEVQVIVMACNEEEAGKAKCEKYWVDEGEERQFGMINVKLLKSSTVCPDFSVRTMRLKYTNNNKETEERTVCQLHYVAWPDHGVPTVVQPLLDMVRLVRDTQASETLPVLVHCSAGCGRTGTICAIDYVWGLLRTGKLTSDFSLLHLIREMRKQRIAMVQTKEQYVLVHQAVRELFKEQLSMIDSHPYENVDTNGLLLIKEEDENLYDTIDYVSSHSFDEKFDNKEKETDPPPLPSKKNVTKFSSKYEKEIVNRTAQQRSLNNKSAKTITQRCSSEVKKITNEKEPSMRNSKNSVNKFSNIEVKKPIPAKGILCVPQLESVPKCKANVKRSKSLKVVRQCEKTTLSVPPCYSPESKRRSSLESNFDEQHLIANIPESYNVRRAVEPVLEERKKGISHLVSKYEILKNSERQTFVRSLTCVDIRPKTVFSHTNSIVSSLEESLAKHKVKLMRSNSQINVLKKSSSTYYKPNTDDTPLWATRDSTKTKMNASQSIYTSLNKVSHEKVTTEDKSKNSSCKIGKKPMEGHSFALKAGLGFRYPVEKDNLVKHSERIQNPVFSRLEATKVSEDIYKSTNRCKFELDNQFPLDGSLGNYSPITDRSKRSHDADDLLSTPKTYNSGSCSDNSEQSSHSSIDSKIVNRLDHLKLFNGSKRHPSALNHLQSSQHYEDYSRIIGPNPGELGNIRGIIKDLSPKRDVDFTQLYTVEKHSDSNSPSISRHENVRIPAQHVKPSNNFRGVDIRPSNRGYNLMNGDIEEVQRPDKNKFSQATISSSNVPSSREYSHQSTDVNYIIQNRKNVHHYNGYIHSSQNIPKMGYPTSTHSNQISENSNSSRTNHASYYSPETPSTFKNSYFHSAPGVDLDRVAASITKNDESLMKATLEELQVRQSKLQMTPKEKKSTKGVPSCSSSSDKKKQQQYL